MSQAFNLTAQLNLRGPSNIRTVVADIRRQLGTVTANVNLRVDPNANRSLAQLNRTLQAFNTSLAATQTAATSAASAISNLGQAINAASLQNVPRNIANVGAATQRLAQNANATAQQVRTARTEMEEFGRQSALAIRRFAAFTTVTSVVFAFTNAVKQGVGAFIEFDKEFVKLQQVTGESANGLQKLASSVTSLASGLGVASSDLIKVSSTLAQAGLNARDTEKALKALALSALAPSFDNLNSTVEGSIALMRQFGISAGDLEKALGSVNSVAAQFAVESSDIIAAIQRTGGVFAAASKGVSEGKDALNEFIAVFTSVRATTRESAETIATGLRTIFTRIQRGSTIEALKEFGVTLTDSQGKFVGAYKAIELLSKGLNQIDPRDLKFSQIVEELGGFRQIGKVIPLIQQFATAQQALKVAQEGQGSLAADAVKAQLSLANQIAKVREEFLALIRELGGSDTFQTLAKGALSLASGLIKVADSVKGVLPALTALMAIKGASAAFQFGAGFVGGIRRGGGARGLGNRLGGGRNANGGVIRSFKTGGQIDVPVALMPGEAVLYPDAVQKVGISKLRQMNQADRTGKKFGGRVARYSRGGVAQVPGSGRTDSFYTSLPEGSFVIRKDATSFLGMNNIAAIAKGRQKFKYGSRQPLSAKEIREYIKNNKLQYGHLADSAPVDIGGSLIGKGLTGVAAMIPGMLNQKSRKGGGGAGLSGKQLREFIKKTPAEVLFAGQLGLSSRGSKYKLPSDALAILKDPKNLEKLKASLRRSIKVKGSFNTDQDLYGSGQALIGAANRIDPKLGSGLTTVQELERNIVSTQQKTGRKRTTRRDSFRTTSALYREMSKKGQINVGSILGNQKALIRNIGGIIQSFGRGSNKPLQSLDSMSRADLIKEAKSRGIPYDYELLGLRRPLTSDEIRRKQGFIDALNSSRLASATQQGNIERIGKKRKLAVVGLTGEQSSETVVTPGLKSKKGSKTLKGVPATLETGALPKSVATKVQAIIRNRSERIVGAVGKIIAQAAGTTAIKDKKVLRAIISKQLPDLSGLLFESGLAAAGAPYDPKSKAIDFNRGLGKELSGLFGIDPKALTDATNDATKEQAKRKLSKGQFDRGRRDLLRAKKAGLKKAFGGMVQFLGRGGLSNRLAVSDHDMTGAITQGKETPSLSQFKDPRIAVPDILGGKPTGLVKLLREYGATQILTARSGGPKGEMRDALQSFYKKNGLLIPQSRITTLGDQINNISTPERKARALFDIVKKYGSVDFFDDDPRNIDAAKTVRGVNARRVKVRKALGGEIFRFGAGGLSTDVARSAILGKRRLSAAEMMKASKRAGYDIERLDNGKIQLSKNGKAMHTLDDDEASKLLGSFMTGYHSGGIVRLAKGGTIGTKDTVPALLTPGEFVINKHATQRIGAANLQKFNRGGFVQKLAGGGVPQDGSFVRLVQQFKQAGDDILTATKKARQAIEQQANATSSSDKMVGQRSSARQDDIQQNRLNRARAQRGLSTSSPVVDAARTKQEYIAQTRARVGTTSTDPTPSGTSLRSVNRAASRAGVSLRRDATGAFTTRDFSGNDMTTAVQMQRLQRRARGRASFGGMTPDQMSAVASSQGVQGLNPGGTRGSFGTFSQRASAISNNAQNARNLAAQRAGSGPQTNLSAAGQAYLAQLNATKTPLQRLSAGLQGLGKAFSSPQSALQSLMGAAKAAGTAVQQAGSSIKNGFSGLMGRLGIGSGGGGSGGGGGLGSGSAAMRAQARQLRGQGLRGQDLRNAMGGSAGSRAQSAAFGLSFAVPMIADQMTVENPKTANQASNNAMVGGIGSAVGSAAMLASMGPVGMAAALPVAAVGVAKAFADAKNAALDFAKNAAQNKLIESSENVANVLDEINKKGKATPEALDKLTKELSNTIAAANAVGQSVTATQKASLVQTELGSSIASFFLGGGKEGSTDRGSARGAINRSMILEQKGTMAYLQSAGNKNTELNMMAEIAPQIAKEAAKSFAIAADAVSAVMQQKFEKGASVTDIFKDPAWKDQANVIARSNAEISRQLLLIESDTRLTDDEIKARKESIVAAYAESKVREQFNLAEAQRNMQQLAKSTDRLSFSFNRMLQNMDAAVQASTDGLKQMSANIDLVSASLSGQAKIGNASGIEQVMNILKNPKGYSATERQGAISTGASLFGGQGSNVQRALTASSSIEDTILSVLNQAGSGPSVNNESLGIKLENSIRSKLSNIGFPPDLADKIGKEINAKIGELRKNGEDKIDFTELVEKIPALGKSIDILKGANEGVVQALDGLRNAFDTYSEQSNRLISLQVDINNKLRASQSILTKGSQTLASALGRNVPMNQQLDAADQPIRAMTGGTTDPAQIRANINRLENTRGQLQQGMQGAQNRQDFGAVQAFNTELIRTNSALRDNYEALETLANSGEKASIALDEVNKIQQKQQAGTGLVEGLVTSTPRELASMNSAMARLERNMRGESNGPTTSGQRKESLDLFNRIAPLLGDRQGALKANVLQSQLRESGIQETPFIRGVLDSLRNPEADPEMKAATDAYRAAIVEQSRANQQLALINSSLAQNIAQQTADAIKNAIEQTRIKFDDKQLADLLSGINNVPQGAPVGPAQGLASGGIVYKASGGEMFTPRGTDTVPAMLTPGEFVVNRQATAKHMPLLKSINNGTSYYASGGLVKSSFINDKVNEDINASEVTKKLYPIISSAVYGPGMGTKIVGEPAAIIPTRSGDQNISGPIFEATRGWMTAEEAVKKTENQKLNLAPTGAELGYSTAIRGEPKGTAYRPTWARFALPNFSFPFITLADKIPLPPNFITSNDVSLFGSPKPLLKTNKGTVTKDNYKESPDASAISVQQSIATELLNNLSAINIKSDNIASNDQKYPQQEWFDSKLRRIDLNGYPSVEPSPLTVHTTVPLSGKLMNVQAVNTDGTPTALFNKKSKSPTLTAVKGTYGNWMDIGYANDAIYGPIDASLTKEQLDKFNNAKNTYVTELQKYINNELKEAQSGQFIKSDATRNASASSTLLDQIVSENFAGLYVTIPGDQLKDDWKSKGGSLSIFRKSLLTDWRKKLDAFKNTTAKIYSVNDNTKATIDSFPGGLQEYPWVAGNKDILDNVVAQFAGEAAQARADFKSEFMMAEMATKEDMANDMPYAFSYRKIRSPKLKEADGFAKPTDPRAILDGIIVDPTKEPKPNVFNPFAAATTDASYRFFPGTPEALVNTLRAKIIEASDAEKQKKIMGPTGIPGLTKLFKVPGGQTTSWISPDDMTRAFFATDPADGVPLYDQMVAFRKNLAQQAQEAKAAAGGQAKIEAPQPGVNTDAITNNLIPLSRQVIQSTIGPKAGVLSSYGYRLFPVKIFQDVANMASYLGQVGINFGKQIVKPLRQPKPDPKKPPPNKMYEVPEALANVWGTVESAKEIFEGFAKTDYTKIAKFISISAGVPSINVPTLLDYAKMKGQQAAAFLNVKDNMNTEFNNQVKTDVQAAMNPAAGAIEQAVLDAKTGNISFKKADAPANLADLGKLSLDPYSIMPSATRTALLDQLNKQLTKMNAGKLIEQVAKVTPWLTFQDDFIASGEQTVAAYLAKSTNRNAQGIVNSRNDAAEALKFLTGNSLGILPDVQKLEEIAASRKQRAQAKDVAKPQTVAQGGIIYADKGTLVNYQPRGTDTVPAMLTPGEFVVNRKSTQDNLPLLKAINSGQYQKGGKIGYLANGGIILPKYHADPANPMVSGGNKTVGVSNLQLEISNDAKTALQDFNRLFGENAKSIDTFSTKLQAVANTLSQLAIPEQIQITAQHKVEVILNGAQALNGAQEGLKQYVVSSINTAISKLNVNTENALGESSNKILKGNIA